MKLLIVGSRSIKRFDLSPYVPKDVELIISGRANEIDFIAEKYADKHKISNLICVQNIKSMEELLHLNGMKEWLISQMQSLQFGMVYHMVQNILLNTQECKTNLLQLSKLGLKITHYGKCKMNAYDECIIGVFL